MKNLTIECMNLTKAYDGIKAVNDFSVGVGSGKILSLLGPSGSGKTTILRLIAGFENPDSGSINIQGNIVFDATHCSYPEQRHIGMVFQDYALFPHLSVGDNIAFGISDRSRSKSRVQEMLSLVDLVGLEKRRPHDLSGGQQQRVALARALASQPDILLLDEPFSNLDADLRTKIRKEVLSILTEAETTAIFVTHDREEALFMGHNVGILNNGYLEQVDSPENVFDSPITKFAAQTIGFAQFLPVYSDGHVLSTELGRFAGLVPGMDTRDLELLVRPDDLRFRPSEGGQAKVQGRVFQGAFSLYEIALDSGHILSCLQPHTRELLVGTRVRVSLRNDHKLTCFLGDGQSLILDEKDRIVDSVE